MKNTKKNMTSEGEMTDEQYNHALTLVKGECWHEWEWKPKDGDIHIYECKCGLRVGGRPQNPDHLSDPYPFIKWMEKEIPEVWEGFLGTFTEHPLDPKFYTKMFNWWLNLKNLVDYLGGNPEWGISECQHNCDTCWRKPENRDACREKGKIIHPALAYLKNIKEEG